MYERMEGWECKKEIFTFKIREGGKDSKKVRFIPTAMDFVLMLMDFVLKLMDCLL